MFLSNEATFDEFMNFGFDYVHDVRSKLSLLLLNQLGIRFDVKTMHDHLRIETRHIFIAPGKDIYILSYESYKVLLLRWQYAFTYRDEFWVCLITHINLDYFIFGWRLALFETLFLLMIKLLIP